MCSKYNFNCMSNWYCFSSNVFVPLSVAKGPCHEAVNKVRPGQLGAFIPQCSDDGYYLSSQCHSSSGHCWCVNREGVELDGTRSSPGEQRVDCDAPGK